MNIYFEGLDGTRLLWRFNTHMLSDHRFVEFISNQIDFFISTNSSPEISASLYWEALKAFLRGGIISYTSHKVRLYKKGYSEITQK